MESISWKVIDTYFKNNTESLVAHHLDSYNDFFHNGISQIFKENNPIRFVEPNTEDVKIANECRLYLAGKDGTKVYFGKPVIYDDNRTHYMYPNDARLRNMTYGATVHYDVEVEIITKGYDENGNFEENTETFTIEKVYLGKFPIMLRSKLCILNGLEPGVRYNMGECRSDYGGYFIIDGKEKVIISQETFADNALYVRNFKEGDKYVNSAEIRSVSEDASKPIRTTKVLMVSPDAKYTNKQIVVDVPNVRKPVPLFILMRALGVISDKSIIDHCLLNTEKYAQYVDYFIPSVHGASEVFTQKAALEFIATFTKKRTVSSVLDILMNYFIPHIGTENLLDKAYFIGYMTFKMLKVHSREERPTDRDNFKYKRIEQPGKLLYDLFREYYLIQQRSIFLAIDKEYYFHIGEYKDNFSKLIETETNYREFFKVRDVETGFKRAFKGKWGSQTHTSRLGVVQDLNRLSWNSFISQMRKLNLPLDASAKVVGPRHLNGSQWGFIDPVDTPDGGNIGLHKHLAISTHITHRVSSIPMIKWLRANTPMKIIQECSPLYLSQHTKVIVNGNWIGVLAEPIETIKLLRLIRRNGIIPVFTSISFDYAKNEIHIFTDGGRMTRPIYYIENGKPSFTNNKYIDLLDSGELSWNDIVSGLGDKKDAKFHIMNNRLYDPSDLYDGENLDYAKHASMVEYIDSAEEDSAMIATYNEDLNKDIRYTHIEIHPSLLLGVMGNMVIYPENNPYPRNAFSCGQSKQAVSIYHSNFQRRIDKMGVILNYGQIPLIKSRYLDIVNKEQQPYGVNAIVAIMSYTGYNVEDAILVSKGAVERGLFRTTYFSMYESREESSKVSGGVSNSYFADVGSKEVMGTKKGYDYGMLDKHGLIKEGTVMNDKYIVIGKLTSDEETTTDSSVKPKKGQMGYVDKSFITDGEEGFRVAKVRIREERIPAIGDKMASRAGQKGTIGLIIPDEDMPYTHDGIRPDLIINPHAIPSRMTIGQLIESLFGKACTGYGAYGDCTAFTTKGANLDTYGQMLTRVGFHSSGTQVLYNGMSGEQLSSDIFIGPTYYMRLKHMVKDKINYRARGPINSLTRQSVHGRANDGGLRIGEMERDGVIAHGAAHFLSESFLERGDEYYMAVCNKTGMISIYNTNQNLFVSPQVDGPVKFHMTMENKLNVEQITRYGRSFSVLRIPYSFKLLIQEMQAMNVQFRIITEDNADNLLSMTYSDNIIKLSGDDVTFQTGEDKDYLSEYVVAYKRVLDRIVSKMSADKSGEFPVNLEKPVPAIQKEPSEKDASSESYHPAPSESSNGNGEESQLNEEGYEYIEGTPEFSPVTPPMDPLASNETNTSDIPPPPASLKTGSEQSGGMFSQKHLNDIYDSMNQTTRDRLDRLSHSEKVEILNNVYKKKQSGGMEHNNSDIASILDVQENGTKDDDGDDNNSSDNDGDDEGSSTNTGGSGTKKVSFTM